MVIIVVLVVVVVLLVSAVKSVARRKICKLMWCCLLNSSVKVIDTLRTTRS